MNAIESNYNEKCLPINIRSGQKKWIFNMHVRTIFHTGSNYPSPSRCLSGEMAELSKNIKVNKLVKKRHLIYQDQEENDVTKQQLFTSPFPIYAEMF